MSARPRATAPKPAAASVAATETAQRRLMPALAAAAAAAVALAAGPVLGVVHGGQPGLRSWPLLVLLAVLPAALAGVLAARRKPSTAAGVLAGAAALAPGRLLLDAQLAVDASLSQRPELVVPTQVATTPSWPGLGLLLAGHVLSIVAGVLAVQESSALPDDAEAPGGMRQRLVTAAVGAALVIAVGLVMPPYGSNDANLLDRVGLDGPPLAAFGLLAIGLAAMLAVVFAMSAPSWGLFKGVLLGLAAAAGAVVLPWLVAAVWLPWLHVAPGPPVVLAGAAVLIAIPLVPWSRASQARVSAQPRLNGLYPVAGAMAVLAAGGAFAGSRAPLLVAAERTTAQSWLIPAGAIVGVLGVALLVPKLAPVVRPAAAVAWAGVVLAGSVVLRPAVTVGELADVHADSGALYTMLAVVAALLLAAFAAAAGLVDRENSDESPVGPRLVWPAVAAGVLALGAFVAPVVDGPDYHGSGLVQGFDPSFFGVLAALAAVLGGLGLAPVSRPVRALAVLAGVLCVLLVRLLELPIAGGPAAFGAWCAIGGAAVVVLMLVISGSRARSG